MKDGDRLVTDIERIAAWLDSQAAKESELLGPLQQPATRAGALERWMVYKALAQGVRTGAWKGKP